MLKTITHNSNKIEIALKLFPVKETVWYNKIVVPPTESSLLSTSNIFVTVEQHELVEYSVETFLRWHLLGVYTVVKRQGKIIYCDK